MPRRRRRRQRPGAVLCRGKGAVGRVRDSIQHAAGHVAGDLQVGIFRFRVHASACRDFGPTSEAKKY